MLFVQFRVVLLQFRHLHLESLNLHVQFFQLSFILVLDALNFLSFLDFILVKLNLQLHQFLNPDQQLPNLLVSLFNFSESDPDFGAETIDDDLHPSFCFSHLLYRFLLHLHSYHLFSHFPLFDQLQTLLLHRLHLHVQLASDNFTVLLVLKAHCFLLLGEKMYLQLVPSNHFVHALIALHLFQLQHQLGNLSLLLFQLLQRQI